MSSFLNENDDDGLDPNFVPDGEALKTGDDNKNQPDNDTVVVTRVEKPVAKPVEKEVTPSMNELLSSKLVLIENQDTKVADLKDMHEVIAAQESVSRSNAEDIALACEDFFTPRMSLMSFTSIPSKMNYLPTDKFLKAKIAKEEAILSEAKKIATEDVMQYASSIIEKSKGVMEIRENPHEKIEATHKGIYTQVEGKMKRVSSLTGEEFAEAVRASLTNDDVRNSLEQFSIVAGQANAARFILSRLAGLDFHDSVGTMLVHTDNCPEISLDHLFNYAKQFYETDMEDIKSSRYNFGDEGEQILARINNTDGTTQEYISRMADELSYFRRMEAVEELMILLPMCMGVANKIIEACKF